jgi:3-oxoacyl-[acyl-carrier-protein] synthase III
VDTAPALAAAACRKTGVQPEQIRVFVPHQANKRIIDAIVPRIGIGHAFIARDVEQSGNTSGASIPIALDRLLAEQPQLGGEVALLIGFGAGLSYAGQVVRLPHAVQ